MKLKQEPEDFQVEELTDLAPGDHGPFALYRMEKRGWSTPDAIAAVTRRWKIERRRLSYGGLKDRHAHTIQFFTIFHGPRRGLNHHDVVVTYLGQVGEEFTSKNIRANRFAITLREVREDEASSLDHVANEIRRQGVPNYFDDQRFGSVVNDGQFVAKELVLGRFEEALKLALAAPYEHDRGPAKQEKAILREHWGQWPECKALLPRGHARSLVDYLTSHPDDYRGAVARLRPELRGLYLSAFQSHLWNRMVERWLVQRCKPEQLAKLQFRLEELPMHRDLDEATYTELAALTLPLPSARLHLEESDPRLALVESVLAEDDLQLRQLQVKGIREMFFSKGERAALLQPRELTCVIEPDDRHRKKQKAVLTFELPRGAYATLVVKRLQQAEASSVKQLQ